jgi:hypothetical protein
MPWFWRRSAFVGSIALVASTAMVRTEAFSDDCRYGHKCTEDEKDGRGCCPAPSAGSSKAPVDRRSPAAPARPTIEDNKTTARKPSGAAAGSPRTPPAAARPAEPATAGAIAAARKLIDEAIAVKGKAKLAGLQALRITETGTRTFRGGRVEVTYVRTYATPDKMRLDQFAGSRTPVLVRSVAVSGQGGWRRRGDAKTHGYVVEDLAGDELATVQFARWREIDVVLLRAADPSTKLTPGPDETVDGRSCAVIKLSSPYGDFDVELYIDRQTKLVDRQRYHHGKITDVVDLADYRDVGGLQIPYKRTIFASSNTTTLLDVKTAEIDPHIDPAVFDRPSTR